VKNGHNFTLNATFEEVEAKLMMLVFLGDGHQNISASIKSARNNPSLCANEQAHGYNLSRFAGIGGS